MTKIEKESYQREQCAILEKTANVVIRKNAEGH